MGERLGLGCWHKSVVGVDSPQPGATQPIQPGYGIQVAPIPHHHHRRRRHPAIHHTSTYLSSLSPVSLYLGQLAVRRIAILSDLCSLSCPSLACVLSKAKTKLHFQPRWCLFLSLICTSPRLMNPFAHYLYPLLFHD